MNISSNFKKLRIFWGKYIYRLTMKTGILKNFVKHFSSLLPKPTDSSLFEIDDILYPNQDITHTTLYGGFFLNYSNLLHKHICFTWLFILLNILEGKSEVNTSYLLKTCFKSFQDVHYSVSGCYYYFFLYCY